jgi:nucleoside 2-deoxyribosyltransferase
MQVVYIAGPYRAGNAWAVEQHIRAAELAALKVWTIGAVALCPHTMTRHYQGALPDATWLAGDLELVKRCDAVLAIERWRGSSGAQAEIAYAKSRDMPVFESIEDLGEWLRKIATQKETGGPVQGRLPFDGEP